MSGPATTAPRTDPSIRRLADRGISVRRPAPTLRSADEIDRIRRAGEVVSRALDAGCAACVAGASTGAIDRAIHAAILAEGASPAFLGYRGAREVEGRPPFPASSCICVGEELVHAVPGARIVRDGELVSIDVGVTLDGWCADAARTVLVGAVDARARAMVACAERMLARAIASARPGVRWSSIAAQLEDMAVAEGFAIAADFVGHGVGRALHEPPQVPCALDESYASGGDFTLRPGLVLAIEPMLVLEQPRRSPSGALASPACVLADDGWTVATASGAPSCHVEHTVAVHRTGAEVLTRRAA